MNQRLPSLAEELRIIRAARRAGRRLKIHPMLTDSQPVRAREEHLASVLAAHKSGDE